MTKKLDNIHFPVPPSLHWALNSIIEANTARIGREVKPPPLSDRPLPASFHQGAVGKLVKYFDLNDSNKRYLVIFDLDGTIWRKFDNHLAVDFLNAPNYFPIETFQQLQSISRTTNRIKPLFLTARASTDIYLLNAHSNVMHGLDCYASFGYVRCRKPGKDQPPEWYYRGHAVNDKQRIAGDAWDRCLLNIGRILEVRYQGNVIMVGDENGFYLRFNDHSIQHKDRVISELKLDFEALNEVISIRAGLNNGEKIFDFETFDSQDAYLTIFNNKTFSNIDKSFGVDFIFEQEGIDPQNPDPNLKVVILGDSSADLVAMKRAKQLLPAANVFNVSVGPGIDDPAVDLSLAHHSDTQRFIQRLSKKVQSKFPS